MAVTRASMLAVAIAVCACQPAFGTPAADFTAYLESYGQVFTPEVAPANAADWHRAVESFPFPGAQVESAIYGKVTCVDPTKNCANRGLARPGEALAIWIITFRDAPAAQGCPVWATVDGNTGEFINGTGPPCS